MMLNKHAANLKLLFVLASIFLFSINSSFAQTITKKRGKVTTTYSDGKKEASGKVKNFKKQGTWKYWNEAGNLEKLVTYKDDQKNGLYTEYYNDGTKSSEGNYVNDDKNGTWITWYANGKMASKLNHYSRCDDVVACSDGIQQWWYENGRLKDQKKYVKNKMTYAWSWYENGMPKFYQFYENGLKEGTWLVYADPSVATDTFPSFIDIYSKGKREGIHKAYGHGKLSEEQFYANDQLNGSYKKWDANGNLSVLENYVKGNRDGLCKYFNNGKCIREAIYSDGKINGTEKEFEESGMMFRISWYTQGQIDSTRNFHPNGKTSIFRSYKYYPGFVRTEEFSTYTEWDAAGNLLLRGTYHFEMKDKDWTTYYNDGKIKSLTPYTAGKIKGVYRKYYSNGKKLIELECDGNSVITQPKVWDEKGNPIKAGTKRYQEIVDSSKPGEIYNDPKKYRENRTSQPDLFPGGDENKKAVGGRGDDLTKEDSKNTNNNQSTSTEITDPRGKGNVPYPKEDPRNPYHDQLVIPKDTSLIFQFAEVMPAFPGGGDTLIKFLQKNIKYPAKSDGKQGTVYISFVVEKDGSITTVKPLKEVPGAPEFTKEAIRVVNSMPKWIPGKMNGTLVRVECKLPVRFVKN